MKPPMVVRWAASAVLLSGVVALGCGARSPLEPEGTPVSLPPEAFESSVIHAEKREWYAWHRKGLELATSGETEQALYCFNRAIEAWPEEMKDASQDTRHRPEPTDTYLQKALLFLEMGRPELALVYFDAFESYIPGNRIAADGRARAEEMLSAAD